MTIKSRITVLVATGSVSLAILMFVGWRACNSLLATMNDIVDDEFIPLVQEQITPLLENDILPVLNKDVHQIQAMNESIKLMLDADRDIYQALTAERAYITASDDEARAAALTEHLDNAKQVIERIQEARKGVTGAKALAYLDQATDKYALWLAASGRVLKLYDNPDTRDEALVSSRSGEAQASFSVFRELLDLSKEQHELDIKDEIARLTKKKELINEKEQLVAESRDSVLAAAEGVRGVARQATLTFLLVGGVAIVTTLVLGYLISTSILRPIGKLLGVSKNVVVGALDRVEISKQHSKDELGELSKAFGEVVTTLLDLNRQTDDLVNAAKNGKLDQRGDSGAFQGAYRDLVAGLNDMVEAFAVPAAAATDAMEQIAKGNLTSRMEGRFCGDFAALQKSINRAVEALAESLAAVAHTGDSVATAAGDMQSGSKQLAAKATQQASALEEVAASLEEMTSMTKQTAGNAVQAKALSDETRLAGDRGNAAMKKLAEAINKIKTSADEQAKIVRTIDDIAFQTNLLALNAAVEAARAGDSGRGFAVVAQEVRNLAQRTAHANSTTSQMIAATCESAEEGVEINQHMNSALDEISTSVEKTNNLIAEIAAAASEQAQGIEQINIAVGEIDNGTQEAASNSQRSLSISTMLSEHVSDLRKTVGRFQFSESTPEVAEAREDVKPTKETRGKSASVANKKAAKKPKPVAPNVGDSALEAYAADLATADV
ncbi:methyl-accepting chemotaxis protein [Botrimarina mediterranea]|uniref:Methyl-accepting chemotaxis protein I n=1 Tax=Botrimarina mediterranea TaxID=2528022 RepID=A0A518K2I5_9BACT|nr:methyl-accepting chemotaxis protein [Botrimarina mediterranea]QDV71965.1 Methyl-accepting chemotaxis protein I [Botrimarina mediterranea]QDV76506.1 Methyl-accepting chemotaxis protein I [Planctomycetes bacterium K2D]